MRYLKIVFAAFSLPLFFSGCMNLLVKEEIYIQNVEVSGPVNHPNIMVTQKDQSEKITISPKIYINKTGMLQARVNSPNVNSSGVYQTDTVFDGNGTWHFRESDKNRYGFKGTNLLWELPDFSSGFDFDFPIGRSTSITGGIQYSVKNGTGLTGGSLGMGFFNTYENSAFRFSFGLNLQEFLFNAQTIVITRVTNLFGSNPEETTILFYHDIDKCSKLNYYMSMTYNTNNENMPVNFFIGGSYFGQSLLSFKPSNPDKEFYPWGTKYTTDTRSEASTSFASLSPGVYLRLSDSNRLLVGANIMMEMGGLNDISQPVMVVPFIKMDFLL